MAYETPAYNYGTAVNDLALNKARSDAARDYGVFLGQERQRRATTGATRQFKEQFPGIGRSFNQRGLYRSGIRKGAEQKAGEDFNYQLGNMNFDFAQQQANEAQAQTQSDVGYQQALLQLFEQLQQQRASTYDPFAALRQILGQ